MPDNETASVWVLTNLAPRLPLPWAGLSWTNKGDLRLCPQTDKYEILRETGWKESLYSTRTDITHLALCLPGMSASQNTTLWIGRDGRLSRHAMGGLHYQVAPTQMCKRWVGNRGWSVGLLPKACYVDCVELRDLRNRR